MLPRPSHIWLLTTISDFDTSDALFPAYDWTMYPFSTQNSQDFQNLMSVYLDAAFKPLIRELDFW